MVNGAGALVAWVREASGPCGQVVKIVAALCGIIPRVVNAIVDPISLGSTLPTTPNDAGVDEYGHDSVATQVYHPALVGHPA